MKREQIEKYIEDHESNYDNKKHFERLLEGMKILSAYPQDSIAAGHDQIYLSDVPEEMREQDVFELGKLGFFIDEDSWCMFT